MVKESLVNALKALFVSLREQKGAIVDRAALVPAYDGAVAGLYILTVSMPDNNTCSNKIECLILGVHEYMEVEDRKSIAGVRVFNTADEFDYYIRTGYGYEHCEPCMQYMQTPRAELRPEIISIAEYA